MSTAEPPVEPSPPLVRVVRGSPTAEELAALVGVLVTRTGEPADTAAGGPAPSAWVASGRPEPTGVPGAPGPGAWRRSALPR
ncbi:MAG TPA: acyl-CoA carboxylase subunit epsilon [Pilimelia sp.]|nr:acyl-CoA carboxylase subunit epsilon [Pilimelia sp.]